MNKSRSRWIVWLLVLLFFGSLFFAWSLYFSKRDWLPRATKNNGQLIQPALSFSNLPLKSEKGLLITREQKQGQWILVYVAPHSCGQLCQTNLYKMRQVRLALGKNRRKLDRWLLVTSSLPMSQRRVIADRYVGTQVVFSRTQALQAFLKSLPSVSLTLNQGGFYLVDPAGNVMMNYSPEVQPKAVLSDIKHLLRVSSYG